MKFEKLVTKLYDLTLFTAFLTLGRIIFDVSSRYITLTHSLFVLGLVNEAMKLSQTTDLLIPLLPICILGAVASAGVGFYRLIFNSPRS